MILLTRTEGFHPGEMPVLQPVPIATIGKHNKYWIAFKGKRSFRYMEDWHFRMPTGEMVVIPKGEITDGASIPWIVTVIMGIFGALMFNPIGVSLMPALLHDFLYQHHYLPLHGGGTFMQGCERWEADDMFKRVHVHSNDMLALAYVTYSGLHIGSRGPWRRARELECLPVLKTAGETDE